MIAKEIIWNLCSEEAKELIADINCALEPGEPVVYLRKADVQCLYDRLLEHSYGVVTLNYIMLLRDENYVEPDGADELNKEVLKGWWVYYTHIIDQHSCLHILHRYNNAENAMEKYRALLDEEKYTIMVGNSEEV